MTLQDAILQSFHHRILDDERYCQSRLGRIPDGAEIDAAISTHNILERSIDIVAEGLDPLESQLWDTLGGEQ